jgi:hypothetical protein
MSTSTCTFKVIHQCSVCNKNFKHAGDLAYHISWAHPVRKIYLSDDKIIDCEFCTAHVHESEYTHHILARHPEEQ